MSKSFIKPYGNYEGYDFEVETDPQRKRDRRMIVRLNGELIGKTSWCVHGWAFMCRARQIVHLDKRKRGEA